MLAFQNLGHTTFQLPELTLNTLHADASTAKFDLQLTLAESTALGSSPSGMDAEFAYATDLFDAQTVQRLAARYLGLLRGLVADPDRPVGDIDLLDEDERRTVLRLWNDTRHEVPETTLVELFEGQVSRTPERDAVIFEEERYTYAAFAERANRVARFLIGAGVGPETTVAVTLRRSADQLVAIYAALIAGAAYVPVDPDLPVERIDYILAVSDPVVVLTEFESAAAGSSGHGNRVLLRDAERSELSGARVTDAERRSSLRPGNTAYLIFTSGSTGRPKGVAVSHRAVVNRLLWMQARVSNR